MAADSGVLLGIILVRSSFAIGYFSPGAVERTLCALTVKPFLDSGSGESCATLWNLPTRMREADAVEPQGDWRDQME
jgi:hypothetical protein